MIDTYEKKEIQKQTEHVTDDDGIERPLFRIAGKKIAFRTRQETPSFIESEQLYHIASLLDSVPLIFEQESEPGDFSAFTEASQEMSGGDVIEMVTATPEGLVGAAIELGGEDTDLVDIQESLHSGEYSAKALQLLDTMAAALNFDDNGEKLTNMDTDGHALVLRALLGDEQASKALDSRREAMYAFFDTQKAQKAIEAQRLPENYRDIESIDPREVVLVHSTGHGVVLAEDGSTILRPASAFPDARVPRASIHFTPNGQVSPHYGGGEAWGAENCLIVSNLADVIQKNDDMLPTAMSTADTFFTLDPGRGLELPDVRVVRPVIDNEGEELLHQEGGIITYKESDFYTEKEKSDIEALAREYGLNMTNEGELNVALREIALRMAMQQKGANRFVKIGAHYTYDRDFQEKYDKLASEMGVTVALHAYTGESYTETNAYFGMARGPYSKKHYSDETYWTFRADATIQAVRQVIASGYVPARPFASTRSVADDGPWF